MIVKYAGDLGVVTRKVFCFCFRLLLLLSLLLLINGVNDELLLLLLLEGVGDVEVRVTTKRIPMGVFRVPEAAWQVTSNRSSLRFLLEQMVTTVLEGLPFGSSQKEVALEEDAEYIFGGKDRELDLFILLSEPSFSVVDFNIFVGFTINNINIFNNN